MAAGGGPRSWLRVTARTPKGTPESSLSLESTQTEYANCPGQCPRDRSGAGRWNAYDGPRSN
eukprot:14971180-Alexandrium_andersonii.AAC.1